MTHLFLFHRDLRIHDNTSLLHQLQTTKQKITPIFIFTPEQIEPSKNKYFSNNSVQFLIETLQELYKIIQKNNGELYFFYGDTIKVLSQIHQSLNVNSIAYNVDYTPYARKRDEQIRLFCKKNNILQYCHEDYPLYDFLNGQTLKSNDKKPYLVYTPFMKFVSTKLKVRPVNRFNKFSFQKNERIKKISTSFDVKKLTTFYQENPSINVKGGRSEGLKILAKANTFKNYEKCRNNLSYDTTKLSAYLHYTPISIREVYEKFKSNQGIFRELIFRDFYMNIVYYFPHVLEGQVKGKNKSFRREYDSIIWKGTKSNFKKWCEGSTGFPVVDAGMRQMNQTGYMHNRCRMIVSNFLVKDLHVDWHLGEQYFATGLEDYDPINNSSGWQWSTGNGTDAQPYFRIFNPWTQQKDYDSKCEYIKTWIPELESVSASDIQKWYDPNIRKKYPTVTYPAPIVNHDEERKITLEMYKKALK
jgi:deoxyribodipyrimidine photo-lyase